MKLERAVIISGRDWKPVGVLCVIKGMRKKRKGPPHERRGELRGVVHVGVKLLEGLPSLRRGKEYRVLEGCFRKGKERFGCKLVHFGVMSNHVHLIVVVEEEGEVSRFMQGLAVRVAKGLNRLWRRKGTVFAERFFARAASGWKQMKRLFHYVLCNARKHGIAVPRGHADRFTSARWGYHVHGKSTRPLRSPPVVEFGGYSWSPGDGPWPPSVDVDHVPGTHFLFV